MFDENFIPLTNNEFEIINTAPESFGSPVLSEEQKQLILEYPFVRLHVEVGPYCKFECPHCYGRYSPRRNDSLAPELVDTLVTQIPDSPVIQVTYTGGEIFSDSKLLSYIIERSQGFPYHLFTNGFFAKTEDNARSQLENLRYLGFNPYQQVLRKSYRGREFIFHDRNSIAVSIDRFHPFNTFHYAKNLVNAYINIFSPKSHEDRVTIYAVHTLGSRFSENIMRSSIHTFKFSSFYRRFVKPFMTHRSKITVHYDSYSRIKTFIIDEPGHRIVCQLMDIAIFEHNALSRATPVAAMNTERRPDIMHHVALASNGNLYFGNDLCRAPGRLVGNLKQNSLNELLYKLKTDEFYQWYRLNGLKGLLKIVEIETGLPIYAHSQCDACRQIFSNLDLLEQLKTKILSRGLDLPRFRGQ